MTRRRPNALLSVPPRGVHGLDVAGGRFFQQTVGRPPKPEDYHGVHTTTQAAFPEVQLPPNPFPVQDINLKRLKRRLLR